MLKLNGESTKLFVVFTVLFEPFFFVLPAYAQPTYDDISKSISGAFNSSNVLLSTLITLLFFMFLSFLFRLSWIKKEKDLARAASQKVKLKPLNPGQKRNWYRLKTQDLRLKWIPLVKSHGMKEKHYLTDYLVDLSGGGLCFETSESINAGDVVKINLDLEGNPLSTQGTVVRVDKLPVEETDTWKVSVEFRGLPDREREQIISFIMKRQRNSIQNEKNKDSTPAPDSECNNPDSKD